jgi:hypothetical protein
MGFGFTARIFAVHRDLAVRSGRSQARAPSEDARTKIVRVEEERSQGQMRHMALATLPRRWNSVVVEGSNRGAVANLVHLLLASSFSELLARGGAGGIEFVTRWNGV